MKLLTISLGLLSAFLLSVPALAQEQKTTPETNTGQVDTIADPKKEQAPEYINVHLVYTEVEQFPQYPGGDAALYSFISKNFRYPEKAIRNGVEGKVYVSFIVDDKGNTSNVKVLKGVDELNDEAVRVVGMLNGFTPAKQGGEPVYYRYILPVKFQLNTSSKSRKK